MASISVAEKYSGGARVLVNLQSSLNAEGGSHKRLRFIGKSRCIDANGSLRVSEAKEWRQVTGKQERVGRHRQLITMLC
ncbi:unnamed protein product [Haemonchus placei]|uniref:NADH-quinone oxidoreductase subunit G n=1 Tax=Haemonchus placei TaxID=6290 RepID=A0A0N4X3V0_HAEPC|nr:unnamed protein product [Haemonchus placei]